MSKLSAGNYKLKVYFARPNMKYEESDIAFNGLLNLTLNKKERVVLKSELSLPEIWKTDWIVNNKDITF